MTADEYFQVWGVKTPRDRPAGLKIAKYIVNSASCECGVFLFLVILASFQFKLLPYIALLTFKQD